MPSGDYQTVTRVEMLFVKESGVRQILFFSEKGNFIKNSLDLLILSSYLVNSNK